MSETGNLIRTRRLEKGMSQLELAKKLGWGSPQFISNIERGIAMLPPAYFRKAAKILGVNTWDLVNEHLQDYANRLHEEAGL